MGCNKSKHAAVASGNTIKPVQRIPVASVIKTLNDSVKRSNIFPVVMDEIQKPCKESGNTLKIVEESNTPVKPVNVEYIDGYKSVDNEAESANAEKDDLAAEEELVRVEKVDNVVDGERDVLAEHVAEDEIEQVSLLDGSDRDLADADVIDNSAGNITSEAVDAKDEMAINHEDEEVAVAVAEEKCDVAADITNKQSDEVAEVTMVVDVDKSDAVADEEEKCDDLPTEEAIVELEVSVVETQIDENNESVESASETEDLNEDNAEEDVSAVKTSQESVDEFVIEENIQSVALAEEVYKNGASVVVIDRSPADGEEEMEIVSEENVVETREDSIEELEAAEEEVADAAGVEPEFETGASVVVGTNDAV